MPTYDEIENRDIRDILGYLNFSSGNYDPRFYNAWNSLFSTLSQKGSQTVRTDAFLALKEGLRILSTSNDAFRHSDKARQILDLIFEDVLPAYRKFHEDILFHQNDDFLFNSFFIAHAHEIALAQKQWIDKDQVIQKIITDLNDFLGYRPIPVLEGVEKHEPNIHEWIAPLPLYRNDVGAAFGPYQILIQKTVQILKNTDSHLLQDAWFDPEKLKEIVMDPRSYDFDHPVNRRPNYSFGTWDPHDIDAEGYYRRFVIHQITVEGILQRVKNELVGHEDDPDLREMLYYEAAAVLAGTMLMGSGISGDHVQAHDSTVSLAVLMPLIADYRDRFYEELIKKIPHPLKERLEREAARLYQPFGGARQNLNKYLAKQRADQLQRFHLARTFARMGYFDSAMNQTKIIAVASARFLCQIDCYITEGHLLVDKKEYQKASEVFPKIEDLLFRGIACGALPDPWSMLGFGGEYSLFSAVDNTIHDHRIDDLINLMNDIFDLYSRVQKEAAVSGDTDLQADLSDRMSTLAGWWDQYGSTEVSNVDGFSGLEVWESATRVSNALAVWHKAGTASGDVAFWSRHVDRFTSPKAFVLLCEALLEQNDLVSSMSLLMHWLAESERIPLQEGDYSFHSILVRWIQQLWKEKTVDKKQKGSVVKKEAEDPDELSDDPGLLPEKDHWERWKLMIRFLDRLEANADRYWMVPTLDLDPSHFDKVPGDHVRKPVPNPSLPARKENVSISLLPMIDSKIQLDFHDFWKDYLKGSISSIEELTHYVVENFRKKNIPQDKDALKSIFRSIREKESGKPIGKKREKEFDLFFDFWYDQIINYIQPHTESGSSVPSDKIPEEDISRQELENTKHLADLFVKSDPAKMNSPDQDPLSSDSDTQFFEFLKKLLQFIENSLEDPQKRKSFFKEGNWLEIGPGELIKLEIKDENLIMEFLEKVEDEADSDPSDDEGYEDDDLEDDDFEEDDFEEDFENDFVDDEDFEEDPDEDIFGEEEDFGYSDDHEEDDEEDDDEGSNIKRGIDSTYNAAYDNMSFEDSAADGVDDDMMDSISPGFRDGDDFELNREMERIQDRLAFIYSLVKLWKFAGGKALPLLLQKGSEEDIQIHLKSWLRQCCVYKKDLDALLVHTSRYHVPRPSGTAESLMEYDQHRGTKEILLDRIVWSMVEVTDAILFLQAILGACSDSSVLLSLHSFMEKFSKPKSLLKLDIGKSPIHSFAVSDPHPFDPKKMSVNPFQFGMSVDPRLVFSVSGMNTPVLPPSFSKIELEDPIESQSADPLNDEIHKELEKYRAAIMVMSAMFQGKVKEVRRLWPLLLATLEKETLLYIPTSRGGSPRAIVACRCLQQVVLRLLEYAPRLGLLTETFQLLRTIQKMERIRPSMPGAITEFDRLFETATRSIAGAITESSKKWRIRPDDLQFRSIDDALVLYIQKTTDILASCWLSHSQHIRISSVESLMNPAQWSGVKSFIVSYGKDILTQHFLGFRNLRAILHQGADTWIRSLIHLKKENKTLETADHLIDDVINHRIPYQSAVYYLELIFECIAEHYSEYIDYNSTTTHSDHGEKTYMFLDMLRILTSYERIAWNLKPVYWIHDTMLRAKCLKAASLWEESVARRSADISEGNLRNYNRLSEQYGIWLPSIHERLQERHIRPLQIAQMCALIGDAVEDIRNDRPSGAFKELEKRIEEFASFPMGIGFELPEWLNALQEEVLSIQTGVGKNENDDSDDLILNPNPIFEQVRLSRNEIAKQITFCLEQINFGE